MWLQEQKLQRQAQKTITYEDCGKLQKIVTDIMDLEKIKYNIPLTIFFILRDFKISHDFTFFRQLR
jgi:hypothetical protein